MNYVRQAMKRQSLLPVLLALTLLAAAASAAPDLPRRIPVILDTDIGTDIDDSWALAFLLRCPELDLKLVLTDTGDTRYRAKIAAKLLQRAGRTDVPVGIGHPGTMGEAERNLAPWVHGYDLSQYPGHVVEDGIGALIETVMHSPEPVTIIAIGAVPNLAEALTREPGIAARCRFVGMHGSFDVGYGGQGPAAEANVRGDPAALRTVLAAPWRDILLTPLDTCGRVSLSGNNYARIWGSINDPLLRAVIENYCVFAPRVSWMDCDFFPVRSTTLFDCVAVYLATSEQLVEIETVSFRVTDDGYTIRDPHGVRARVALRWKDEPAFEKLLTERLLAH
jgi:inosine-uridine nucleoside N-ribohydrolase